MTQNTQLTMLRDANVQLELSDNSDKPSVFAYISSDNGSIEHEFSPTSRVTQQLQTIPLESLQYRMENGHYFIDANSESLIDFRYRDYSGFVHDDSNIIRLEEVLGVTSKANMPTGARMSANHRSLNSDLRLMKNWSDRALNVPGFQTGGEFNSYISFCWSPFSKAVHSAFNLVRLVCSNGMVGTTSLFNSRIPLINLEHENLDIASIQLQNKIQGTVSDRVLRMTDERATVGELLLATKHITNRLESKKLPLDQRKTLNNMYHLCDPYEHLSSHYRTRVFENADVANQLLGHLTTYDLWNVVTEMCSHTNETRGSTNFALDKAANDLMFNRDSTTVNQNALHSIGSNKSVLSPFSNPEQAFFGDIGQDATALATKVH